MLNINNTYIYPKNEDIEIEVGDVKQGIFKPRMKIKRWDNEVNFSVGIISDHAGSVVEDKADIEWNDGYGVKARFYEKIGDEFEFEIILNEKPKTNVINLSIETKGLDFYYQPELTQDEKDNGDIRPDNVVGSYAVYHSTMSGDYVGGNNYRAGKFCHIYRPYVEDSKGLRVWCDLYIDVDMKVTIPQDFLDKAVYPIVVDPTFGCDPASPGASDRAISQDDLEGVLYTSPSNIDKAQSISVYLKTNINAGTMKGILVLNSNKNIISNGVGAASPTITSTTGVWYTSTFGTDPDLSNSTDYLLMFIHNTMIGITVKYFYDILSNKGFEDSFNSYTFPTNPTDGSIDTHKRSVYCTYTETEITIPPKGRIFTGPFCGPLGGPIQCI